MATIPHDGSPSLDNLPPNLRQQLESLPPAVRALYEAGGFAAIKAFSKFYDEVIAPLLRRHPGLVEPSIDRLVTFFRAVHALNEGPGLADRVAEVYARLFDTIMAPTLIARFGDRAESVAESVMREVLEEGEFHVLAAGIAEIRRSLPDRAMLSDVAPLLPELFRRGRQRAFVEVVEAARRQRAAIATRTMVRRAVRPHRARRDACRHRLSGRASSADGDGGGGDGPGPDDSSPLVPGPHSLPSLSRLRSTANQGRFPRVLARRCW